MALNWNTFCTRSRPRTPKAMRSRLELAIVIGRLPSSDADRWSRKPSRWHRRPSVRSIAASNSGVEAIKFWKAREFRSLGIRRSEIGAMREYTIKPKIANAEESMSSASIGVFPPLPTTSYPAQTPTIDKAVTSSARVGQPNHS